MATYTILRAATPPDLAGDWNDPLWKRARIAKVNGFLPRDVRHRPNTQVKLLYDDKGLYVFFQVRDRYVICTNTRYQSCVCRDSCVEFFVRPLSDQGYFNFEINCGGTMLLYYIFGSPFVDGKFIKYCPVPRFLSKGVRIHHSMPRRVCQEIKEPVTWRLSYFIPFHLFESFVGPLNVGPSRSWRANFYKCADRSSHPHLANWNRPEGMDSFHHPEKFGTIRFGK